MQTSESTRLVQQSRFFLPPSGLFPVRSYFLATAFEVSEQAAEEGCSGCGGPSEQRVATYYSWAGDRLLLCFGLSLVGGCILRGRTHRPAEAGEFVVDWQRFFPPTPRALQGNLKLWDGEC